MRIHAVRLTAPESVSPRTRAGFRLTRLPRSLAALALSLALTIVALAPANALAISRDAVLARAQTRVDAPVKYSQSRYYKGYRTDCSGFVSMSWKTGTSWSTATFKRVTYRIKTSQLKPGDALLKRGYHIRLFYGWVDAAHTEYVAYEAGNGKVAVCRIHRIADDLRAGYYPARYRRITSSPASSNLLKNGSFNVWAMSWSGPGVPVWWQTSGSRWDSPVAQRRDTYRSARSSLELRTTSDDPAENTDISQSVPIATGASYRVSAWAKSAADPRAVELHLVYLDAAGESLAETSTVGDVAGVNGSAFSAMTLTAPAPTGAVAALVTVRLAGGSTTDPSTGAISANSVVLDDLSLVRQ
jgi:hypothetical protein